MPELDDEKRQVRERALEARDAIVAEQRTKKNARICIQLQEIAESAASEIDDDHPTVIVYRAMQSEVNIADFVDWAYSHGWRVAFPCMCKPSEATSEDVPGLPIMRFRNVPHYVYESASDCFYRHPMRSYTSTDPAVANCPVIAPGDVTMAIVPLVAYDSRLMRLGYGGGCYDRFLPRLRPEAIVCGVAYKEQQVIEVPSEEHDVALSQLVTA